jgi:hypothetical protein
MNYNGALVLPKNCVPINSEEMAYVDGGATKYTTLTGVVREYCLAALPLA